MSSCELNLNIVQYESRVWEGLNGICFCNGGVKYHKTIINILNPYWKTKYYSLLSSFFVLITLICTMPLVNAFFRILFT